MEENNNVTTVGNVRLGFIDQLLDVEELESKLTPEGPFSSIKPV